jgi:GT2 family glycosyltransferase
MAAQHHPTTPGLESLPFDLYERYELTRRLIPLLLPVGGEPLRILDVGGHSSPLKHFLPRDRITLVDVQPPGSLTHLPLRYDGYVQGDGARLPFVDDAFDVVTAHDTLEHIPKEDRPAFLTELARVAQRFVIVNGPVWTPDTVWAERRLAAFLERVDARSAYLDEHIERGLPEPQEITDGLSGSGAPLLEVGNGNLWLWLALNAVKNYLAAVSRDPDVAEAVDRSANRALALRDVRGTQYRRAFVAALRPEDASVLDRARRSLRWEPVREDQEAVGAVLAVMEERASVVRAGGGRPTERTAVEPVLAMLDHALLGVLAPHLVAQENLERLVRQLEEQRTGLTPRVGTRLRRATSRSVDRFAPWGSRRRALLLVPRRAVRVLREEGLGAFLRYVFTARWASSLATPAFPVAERFDQMRGDSQYEFWLNALVLSPGRLRAMRRAVGRLRHRPRISVVMPVHDPEPEWLRDAVESVRAQVYRDWELCIADDASTRGDVRGLLRRYEGDPRIRVTYLEENEGIAGASNAALALATGEFVGFLDHDDVLKPNALFEVAKVLNERPNLDYVYSDEDKQELDGTLTGAFFKPGWSPDLLMSVNYVTHFSVYRRTVLENVGGFRKGFDGSQDYDLVLRVTERTDRVGHVPLPLYTWRKVPGSAAVSVDSKTYAWEAGRRALAEAAARRGYESDVTPALAPHRYRVRYVIKGEPRVTIVIPTRDRSVLLRKCIESIRDLSTYPNYEIVIIDNQSREPAALEYLERFDGRVIPYPHQFNYSKLINFAAREAGETDFLLFLNNDTEVIAPDWIEAMVEHGQRPEVGAVGARLLLPDGTPQHEGILVGPHGGLPANMDHRGTYDLEATVHNCAAVTFACALLRPEVFWALGGLDEQFDVAFQDVDFCLRAGEKGYWIVYTPHALLYHDEGGTRGRVGKTHPDADTTLFLDRWGGYRDPFYNPNFDPDRLFRLHVDPRRLPHLRVKPASRGALAGPRGSR